MENIKIINFDDCQYSDRDGTYGGAAGDKDGIIYNNEYWIIKYPKNTKDMRLDDMSYTTAPLSEFIGSHIYKILGYDVHETLLGIRNNKIVVACKDFCNHEGSLREVRTLKNAANKEMEKLLEGSFSSTGSLHMVDLEELLIHLEYNRILSKVEGISDRFWDCAVVDIFINNNDRNNGNWGLLYENGQYTIAPVFDNGAAFSNKVSDQRIHDYLNDTSRLIQSSMNTITGYGINGHALTSKKLLNFENNDLKKAMIKNIPLFKNKMKEIKDFINSIPESYQGLTIITQARKEFYIKGMEIRLEHLLEPELKRILMKDKNLTIKDRVKQAKENIKHSKNISHKDKGIER